MSIILIGLLGSVAAGLATGVGALPALAMRDIPPKVQNGLLGFAAGVMLAASFFSLILPGIESAQAIYGTELAAISVVIAGILIGVIVLWILNEHVPHDHFVLGHEGPISSGLRKVWLFIIAITIHNFPEGLAVGVGFGGGDIENGTTLAIGIGLQNMPRDWRWRWRCSARAIRPAARSASPP